MEDLEDLVADLPIGVYVCEAPTGALRYYNRRAVELWGREPATEGPGELYCGSLRRFTAEGCELARSDTPMARACRNEGLGSIDEELVLERGDGSRVRVRVTVRPLRDRDGRFTRAVGTLQDINAQSLAEEALRASQARYRAIVEDQPELVCRFLRDGTLTFANTSYCEFFGVDPEETIGTRYAPAVHPEDLSRVEGFLETLSPDDRVGTIDNRVVRGDGAVRWTRWTNHALYDDEDRIVEYQATGRDITEEKRAEEAAAHLAAIIEGAEDAVVSKSLDGIITSWNRAAEDLFGFTAEEAVGQPISIIIPADRMREEKEIIAKLARGEILASFETERVRKDGRRCPVVLTISPIRDASGRVVGASKIARDVSERLRTEKELQKTVANLEILYRLAGAMAQATGRQEVSDAAVDAILSAAAADRASILVLDEASVMRFTAWRGLSAAYRAAVDGHSPWSPDEKDPSPILVEDVADDPALEKFREVFLGEGIRSLAFIPLVYRGRLLGKFMIYYDVPHRFTDEEMRVAATVAQHVSFSLARVDSDTAIERLLEGERAARKEADAARQAAERANAEKDEFLAMLAHELRNPLSVIGTAIAVIEASGGLKGGLERAGQMIGRQVEHLARLLDNLLDVARITRGRFQLRTEAVDLRHTVAATLDAHKPRIEAKRQRVSVEIPDAPAEVLGDPVRLQQVLGNVIVNASKFTPAGGSIQVALDVAEKQAVLRVRDEGIGIAPEELESIFEPFTQANASLARTEGGLGLGLTLVKRVVELHGGTVRASSEGRHRGAEFVVRLPLIESGTRAPEGASVAATHPVTPQRILVVEDSEDGREMLMALLRLHGHEVAGASTGQEGIEAALRREPDVAIVDIGLPDMEGYEVGDELRRRLGGRVQLVALTGYGQPSDRARSKAAGFDAHLVKPVEPPLLVETLERLAHPNAAEKAGREH